MSTTEPAKHQNETKNPSCRTASTRGLSVGISPDIHAVVPLLLRLVGVRGIDQALLDVPGIIIHRHQGRITVRDGKKAKSC